MTTEPDPEGAICDICGLPILEGRGIVVQAIADDEGNPIIDASYVWFHHECLNPQ